MRQIFRRLRGWLGITLTWGAGWFIAGLVLALGAAFFGAGSVGLSGELLREALERAVRIAAVGAVAGGLFSAFVASIQPRGKLQDLRAGRIAIGSGLAAVLFVLVSSYWNSPLSEWIQPTITFGAITLITGYGSIRLAQRKLLPAADLQPELTSGSEELLPRGDAV